MHLCVCVYASLVSKNHVLLPSGRTELETLDAPQEEMEFSDRFHNMVSSFGSEKAKRALSSARRNKIDANALQLAISPAVSHVEKLVEGWLLCMGGW